MESAKRKESEANGTKDTKNGGKSIKGKRKKMKTESLLGKYLFEEDFKSKFAEAYRSNKCFKESGGVIHDKPFKCCVLPDFISDEEFLSELKTELLELNFKQKSNDLYKFNQSDDLKTSTNKSVTTIRDTLYQDFRKWLQDVCELELTDQVDMSCAKYDYTDVLLCHDDKLEGRVIAYILYLVPPTWQADDGGTLDLFNVDEHGQPDQIEERLIPKWNSLAFFEVSPVSFHQVSEVLSQTETRLSISGWFHGNPPSRLAPYVEPPQLTISPIAIEDERLVEWLNPLYLDLGVTTEIRDRFEEESEMELQDFLLESKYIEVLKALRSDEMKWNRRGPANKRHYKRACSEVLPRVLRELMELMQSTSMFKLMRTLTGLDLADTPLTNEEKTTDDAQEGKSAATAPDNPRCRGEVRYWAHDNYTLVHDTDPEKAEDALDAMLFFGCEGWDSEEFGGSTTYLAADEDEELLSIQPLANSLALVFRDKETLKFVKHINHKSVSSAATSSSAASNSTDDFYDLHLVYYE